MAEHALGAFADNDPATFEVVKNSLYSMAAEMRVVLSKTAYSPILKSAGDFSCGIFDIDGDMVAQGPDLPMHLGSMPLAVKAVIQAWEEIAPGDVFIHNDPYFGGSHLPDVNVVTPAFADDGRLLGFVCLRAHWPDIGGGTPGSYGTETDIFAEGLRLPPVRLYVGGVPIREVEDIIFANIRTPEEGRGNLRAQVAANRRAVTRLEGLARRYGVDRLLRIMQGVMDYSEMLMRQALADLPDGEGSFEDFCDGDGILEPGETEDSPFTIRLHVKKTGDELSVDFAGTDPMVRGPMNSPLAVTASGVFTAVKTVADSNAVIPPNSGCWRPIKVKAEPGTVVNATLPAPVVYANHEIAHRVCDMVYGAMSGFTPDNVMACSQGTSAILAMGGVDRRNGNRYVNYEVVKGGFGARPNKDGINAIAASVANTANTPVEVVEMSFPLRVERYELIPDSGGAGQYRGGLAARRVWKILDHTAQATVCCERAKSPPFGLFEGKAGAPARIYVIEADGTRRDLNSKEHFLAPAGSEIWYEVPGSGGFGPPAKRDPDKVRADVRDGYVSAEAAKRDYGFES